MPTSSPIKEADMEDDIKKHWKQLDLLQMPKENFFLPGTRPKRFSKRDYQKKVKETVTANSEFISRFSKEYLR